MVCSVVRLVCCSFVAPQWGNLELSRRKISEVFHNNIKVFENIKRFIDLLNQSSRRRNNRIHRVSKRTASSRVHDLETFWYGRLADGYSARNNRSRSFDIHL